MCPRPSLVMYGMLLANLMTSCSKSQVAIGDESAVQSYLAGTTFVCQDQSFISEKYRDKGVYLVLRFSATDFTLATIDGKREQKTSGRYQLSSVGMDEREITLQGASSSLDRMSLKGDGKVTLHLAEKEWKEGVKSVVFSPDLGSSTSRADPVVDPGDEVTNEEPERYEKGRFEELFLGKPDSFILERLGPPDNVDVSDKMTMTDKGITYKRMLRYDNRVFNGSPEAMLSHVYLRFDADDRFVDKILYK